MSDTTTIQVKRHVREELDQYRRELDLGSLSEAIAVLLAGRKRESDLDRVWVEIDSLKKQIALLLQQQGGAGEGDQASE
jgi:predicted CopG family antitoxin